MHGINKRGYSLIYQHPFEISQINLLKYIMFGNF